MSSIRGNQGCAINIRSRIIAQGNIRLREPIPGLKNGLIRRSVTDIDFRLAQIIVYTGNISQSDLFCRIPIWNIFSCYLS